MTRTAQLAPPEKDRLRLGFMRLTDSAPLIYAKENGLFADYGLDVDLVREVSWANLRDRLVVGDLDAAQLLAPLPLMTTYGVGGLRVPLLTGLVLNLNGNALTLSSHLAATLMQQQPAQQGLPDAVALSRALAAEVKKPGARFTFATVQLFSMHMLQLRMWLKAGGVEPDQDVKIIVLPPEQMCDSLARGLIDGFCVGEPWNSLAVQQGIGTIAATGYQIWNNAPEKVLAVNGGWHQRYAQTHLRLRLALMQACLKLAEPAERLALAPVLAQPRYLNLPEAVLLPALTGWPRFSKSGEAVRLDDFLVFSAYQAGFPWRSSADAIVRQCGFAHGSPIPPDQVANLSQQCFRPDLYREAARQLGIAAPARERRPNEGHHAEPWQFEPGIVLGPDRTLLPL
jgi:nitrate/nitrite transport system substrate-binding protein